MIGHVLGQGQGQCSHREDISLRVSAHFYLCRLEEYSTVLSWLNKTARCVSLQHILTTVVEVDPKETSEISII